MFDESCFPKNFIRVENRYYKIENANVICVEESQNTNFYVIYIFSNEEMHVDTVVNVGWNCMKRLKSTRLVVSSAIM